MLREIILSTGSRAEFEQNLYLDFNIIYGTSFEMVIDEDGNDDIVIEVMSGIFDFRDGTYPLGIFEHYEYKTKYFTIKNKNDIARAILYAKNVTTRNIIDQIILVAKDKQFDEFRK